MKDWEKFRTFKERGEWVELQFMAEAASHGYHVLKPCGDSLRDRDFSEPVKPLLSYRIPGASVVPLRAVQDCPNQLFVTRLVLSPVPRRVPHVVGKHV